MRFIIRKDEQRPLTYLLEYLAKAVETCAQVVEVRDHKSKRRLEQNAAYWAMLSEARDWIHEHRGETLDPLIIHEQFKAYFQPIIGSFRCQIVLDGRVRDIDRPVPKSTTQNDEAEFAKYHKKCEAYLVQEYGVRFKDRRYE